jgi:hypothetical protein
MNNPTTVERVIPNTLFQLEKELNAFEARQTRTAQVVKKTFNVLATISFFSTGVTGIFAATWIPALALAAITVAIIEIADQFFTGKKFSVSRDILNDLLSSADPAIQKLFFRYSKACAEETFNHLYSIDPGIEQYKLRKIFLQNVKNKELKELLEKELDCAEGVYLPLNSVAHSPIYSNLHQTLKKCDKGFDKLSPDKRKISIKACVNDWKEISKCPLEKSNRKQILARVAYLLDKASTTPFKNVIFLGSCLNSEILKACAKGKIQEVAISPFAWSEKAIKALTAIPTLKTIIYNPAIARPVALGLLKTHFGRSNIKVDIWHAVTKAWCDHFNDEERITRYNRL